MKKFIVGVLVFVGMVMLGCSPIEEPTQAEAMDNVYFDINSNYHQTVLMNKANEAFILQHPGVYEKKFRFAESKYSVSVIYTWEDQTENENQSGVWDYQFTNDSLMNLLGG